MDKPAHNASELSFVFDFMTSVVLTSGTCIAGPSRNSLNLGSPVGLLLGRGEGYCVGSSVGLFVGAFVGESIHRSVREKMKK